MNKLAVVFGVAAVATLAGCKDPNYKTVQPSQGEVKDAAPVETARPQPEAKPIEIKTVEEKPVETKAPEKPVVEETTIYTVQGGDYLAKISKKFNVTIASIRRLNPKIKKDIIWVGMKLKIPGKHNVPAVEPAKATNSGKKVDSYTGAVKEYVVKSGDTLGAIAYSNGINIRQLKLLNNLTKDSLKIGQKLKIPAEKVVKKTAAPKVAEKPVDKTDRAMDAVAPVAEKSEVVAPAEAPAAESIAPATAPAEEDVAPVADAAETIEYTVVEGDGDIHDVAVRFGVSVAEIRDLNNFGEEVVLTPGMKIKLPAEVQQ